MNKGFAVSAEGFRQKRIYFAPSGTTGSREIKKKGKMCVPSDESN
jgi:hypothetical protein